MGRNSQYNDGQKERSSRRLSLLDDMSQREEKSSSKLSLIWDVYKNVTNLERQELVKVLKGENSSYIGIDGRDKVERAFGIFYAPIYLPSIYLASLPTAMRLASMMEQPAEQKPKTPNRDIM
jgi:hypothetical protein